MFSVTGALVKLRQVHDNKLNIREMKDEGIGRTKWKTIQRGKRTMKKNMRLKYSQGQGDGNCGIHEQVENTGNGHLRLQVKERWHKIHGNHVLTWSEVDSESKAAHEIGFTIHPDLAKDNLRKNNYGQDETMIKDRYFYPSVRPCNVSH